VIAPNLPLPDLTRKKDSGGGAEAPMAEIADRINDALIRLIDEDLIAVRYDDDYVEIEIKSELLFQLGGTVLSNKAKDIAAKLAKVLRNFPNLIRVEGHTDNSPIQSASYPSNWELSAARAGSIVRLFAEQGIHPAQLSAVGYAEYRPIEDNATQEGRIKNRRVNVVVLNQTQVGSLRENLVMAATSKDGKPPVHSAELDGWTPPTDISHRAVTEQGVIAVMPGITIAEPFKVQIIPNIDSKKESQ